MRDGDLFPSGSDIAARPSSSEMDSHYEPGYCSVDVLIHAPTLLFAASLKESHSSGGNMCLARRRKRTGSTTLRTAVHCQSDRHSVCWPLSATLIGPVSWFLAMETTCSDPTDCPWQDSANGGPPINSPADSIYTPVHERCDLALRTSLYVIWT